MTIPIVGNPLGYFQDPLEVTLERMRDLGYDEIELCHSQIRDFRTAELRGQLSEFVTSLGMRLVGSNVPDSEYFQALDSSEDVKVALAGLERDIDIAVDLGMRYLITYEGRVPPGATDALIFGQLLDDTVRLLAAAADYGAARNIDIWIEVHPFTLGTRLEFLVELCDRIDRSNFGIVYDACHFAVGIPDGYIEAIDRLGGRIKMVHFSDSDQRSSELHFPPGRGCLDLDGILEALRRIDFAGPWMLDLYLYPVPAWGSREGLAWMRDKLSNWGGADR